MTIRVQVVFIVIFAVSGFAITPTPPPITRTPTYTPAFPETPTATPSPTWPCIIEYVWLERDLPETCRAGEPFQVTLKVKGGTARIASATEVVPIGWTVSNVNPPYTRMVNNEIHWDGGNWGATYNITPPLDAPPGIYYFSGSTISSHWCVDNIYKVTTGDASCELVGKICQLGDVDCNGILSPADGLRALQIYLGLYVPSGQEPCDVPCAADYDKNSVVTPADALCIFKEYLNNPCR